MKQLSCEMCGSTDLIKDGGVFVCQTCGCKYSVEEAKKMMIEGTVDVKGTVSIAGRVDISGSAVKVDNTDRLNNYYQLARNAWKAEDFKRVEEYYALILKDDPDSWEANFYVVCARAMQERMINLDAAIDSVKKGVESTIKQISGMVKANDSVPSDLERAISEVIDSSRSMTKLFCKAIEQREGYNAPSGFSTASYLAYQKVLGTHSPEYSHSIGSAVWIVIACGESISQKFRNHMKEGDPILELAIKAWDWVLTFFSEKKDPLLSAYLQQAYISIRRYRPDYVNVEYQKFRITNVEQRMKKRQEEIKVKKASMSPSFFAKKRNQIIQEEIDKIQAEIDKEEPWLKQLRDELEAAEAASPAGRRRERYNKLQALQVRYIPMIREFLADGEFHSVEEIKKLPELADLDERDFYDMISWIRSGRFIERNKENGNMVRWHKGW